MYNNQLDALFITNFLNYHTSTCFGPINSASSGGRMYTVYVANGTCYTSKLTVSGPHRPETCRDVIVQEIIDRHCIELVIIHIIHDAR
jgi:hypothetical protein